MNNAAISLLDSGNEDAVDYYEMITGFRGRDSLIEHYMPETVESEAA